jgi:uncharacterized protein YjbI with pentapeptide repeats
MPKPYDQILNTAGNGPSDDPHPAGFLALVQAGADVFNGWRHDYPTQWDDAAKVWHRRVRWQKQNQPNVSIGHLGLSFAGFKFGDGAEFNGIGFELSPVNFEGASFGDDATFKGTHFSCGVFFSGTSFGRNADFSGTVISNGKAKADAPEWVRLDKMTFGDKAALTNLNLQFGSVHSPGGDVQFSDCQFGSNARILLLVQNAPSTGKLILDRSAFGDGANFSDSIFDAPVSFDDCVFGNSVSFKRARMIKANFERACFGIDVDFRGPSSRDDPTPLGPISFARAVFQGQVDFTNRKFSGHTNFGNVRFGKVPLFHDCELHLDTEFTERSFPSKAFGTGDASRAYRTLKLAMSKHQATHEEQFFFRREMREEQLVLKKSGQRGRAMLYGIYGFVSGYGSSVGRPLLAYLFLLAAFAGLYAGIAGDSFAWFGRPLDIDRTSEWLTFSFSNSLPLGGLDEAARQLKGNLMPSYKTGLVLLIVFHKVLGLLSIFLIGLAIRNLFKMK